VIQNFSQFINEKETIRKRAIQKYQSELKMRLQKMIECDILLKRLDEIKKEYFFSICLKLQKKILAQVYLFIMQTREKVNASFE
jgi:hypothetical protein